MHTYICISYSLAYLKYLNKYVLIANVSTYVKYVNTFACQNYLPKIVVLRISVYGRWTQICREKLSYVNSSDTQMYRHILHMWKHLQPTHIYLNILNMLKNS
jgi:membrane associated rhomboid family serine protease